MGVDIMDDKFFDIEKARREKPSCSEIIHFNNAGASLMPTSVVQSLLDYISLEATRGGYEAAEQECDKIENTINSAAKLLNCQKSEIAFYSFLVSFLNKILYT